MARLQSIRYMPRIITIKHIVKLIFFFFCSPPAWPMCVVLMWFNLPVTRINIWCANKIDTDNVMARDTKVGRGDGEPLQILCIYDILPPRVRQCLTPVRPVARGRFFCFWVGDEVVPGVGLEIAGDLVALRSNQFAHDFLTSRVQNRYVFLFFQKSFLLSRLKGTVRLVY